MLRPLLAFLTLGLAAFLLAPTVASVGKGVEDLHIQRELPWQLWKWDRIPPPETLLPPSCEKREVPTVSEVTLWPKRITKNESFTLGGYVNEVATSVGVPGMEVELFLNATKELPGQFLGRTQTGGDGKFSLTTTIPNDLDATRYHLVAHALEKREGCKRWFEHWSDPEMDVTARTNIVFEVPERVVVGHPLDVVGRVIDEVGGPVRGAPVELSVEGKPVTVTTDDQGYFRHRVNASGTDPIDLLAQYKGNKFYSGSKADTAVKVVPESVELETQGARLTLVRSQLQAVRGTVILAPGAPSGPITLTFTGPRIATCETCAIGPSLQVTPDEQGRFEVPLFIPASEPAGDLKLRIASPSLKEPHEFDGTLIVPVKLLLDADGKGLSKAVEGQVRAVDDAGQPVPGQVSVLGVEPPLAGALEAGVFAFEAPAPCGTHTLEARYEGTGPYMPAIASKNTRACGFLAALPAWVLDTPMWVWALVLLLAAALLLLATSLRQRYAATINRGPAFDLVITEPREPAPDVVGVGEPLRATAHLHDPLPKGHTLRIGTFREMVPATVGEDLSAHLDLAPQKHGQLAIRGEVLNERGRVVSRRTVNVRVVRYAAEIEQRYRELKSQHAGDEADVVTPREFERWLRERSPDLDPATASRLVSLFEEADYGPREAGREEFLAYLDAANSIRGVKGRAA